MAITVLASPWSLQGGPEWCISPGRDWGSSSSRPVYMSDGIYIIQRPALWLGFIERYFLAYRNELEHSAGYRKSWASQGRSSSQETQSWRTTTNWYQLSCPDEFVVPTEVGFGSALELKPDPKLKRGGGTETGYNSSFTFCGVLGAFHLGSFNQRAYVRG